MYPARDPLTLVCATGAGVWDPAPPRSELPSECVAGVAWETLPVKAREMIWLASASSISRSKLWPGPATVSLYPFFLLAIPSPSSCKDGTNHGNGYLGKLRPRLSTARSERRRGCSLTGAITGASWILSSDHAAAQGHYRTKPHKSSPRWDSKAHPVTQSNAASIDVTTHWDVASVQSPNPIQLIAEPSSGHQWKSRRESSRRQTKGSAFVRREAGAFSFC
jgi:hypothetical protein